MSLSILKQELKSNRLRGIYLFYGQETWLLNYYTEVIKTRVLDPMTKQLNYSTFDGVANIPSIISNCTTVPMFSDKKLVIIKNTGILKPSKTASEGEESSEPPTNKKQTRSDDLETLSGVFADFPDFTCLLIIEETVDKRLKLYKDIVKYGLAVEFTLQSTDDLEVWVRNICAKENKSFDRRALVEFVQKCGPNMADIRSETDKLILFTGGKNTINLDDVNKVCSFSSKTRVFDLINSLTAGNRLKALRELSELIALKEPVQKIMIMISKHFIQLRQLKSLSDSGISLKDATSTLNLHPYAAGIMWRQCSKYQIDRIDDIIKKCFQQDRAIKNGEIEGDSALDVLISSI